MTNRGSVPLPSGFTASDGRGLLTKLLGQLRSPYLSRIVAGSYRYNDFDLVTGRRASENSASGLVRLLEQQLGLGVPVTVVTCDPFEDNMDPLQGNALRGWYQGLKRLRDAGASVRLHPKLHAKVYLFE